MPILTAAAMEEFFVLFVGTPLASAAVELDTPPGPVALWRGLQSNRENRPILSIGQFDPLGENRTRAVLENTGFAPFTAQIVQPAPMFRASFNPPAGEVLLDCGETAVLDIEYEGYRPTAPVSGELVLELTADGGALMTRIVAEILPPPTEPSVRFTPPCPASGHDFGLVEQGGGIPLPGPLFLELGSAGERPLEVGLNLDGDAAKWVAVESDPPSASCEWRLCAGERLRLECRPREVREPGVKTGLLVLATNSPELPEFRLPLKAKYARPRKQILLEHLEPGRIPEGAGAWKCTLTVANRGPEPEEVSGFVVLGRTRMAWRTLAQPLDPDAPGQALTVDIPTAGLSPGRHEVAAEIRAGDDYGPGEVRAYLDVFQAEIDPPSLDLGQVRPGERRTAPLSIRASDGGPLRFGVVLPQQYGRALEADPVPGGLELRLSPSLLPPGFEGDELRFQVVFPDFGLQRLVRVSFSRTKALDLAVPAVIDFGQVLPGEKVYLEFTVTNRSRQNISLELSWDMNGFSVPLRAFPLKAGGTEKLMSTLCVPPEGKEAVRLREDGGTDSIALAHLLLLNSGDLWPVTVPMIAHLVRPYGWLCAACNAVSLDADFNFCPQCGSPRDEATPPLPISRAGVVACPKCRTEYSAEVSYCSKNHESGLFRSRQPVRLEPLPKESQ